MTVTQRNTETQKIQTIYQTTDYSRFTFLKGNRKIYENHVRRLEHSFAENGNHLDDEPIIVNENDEIIDGQHRYEVCKRNNYVVHYVVKNNYGINQVHRLNGQNQVWTRQDYVASYSSLGYEHYMAVTELATKHNVPLQIAVGAIFSTGDKKTVLKLQSGEIQIDNEKLAHAEELLVILKCLQANTEVNTNSYSVLAAIKTMLKTPGFSKTKFLRKVQTFPYIVKKQADKKGYLENFSRLYNHCEKNTNLLHFDVR